MCNYLNKPIIVVPLGDAAGIGPEIVAKTAAKGFLSQYAKPIILGDKSVFEKGMEIADLKFDYISADTIESALKAEGVVLLNTKSLDAAKVKMGVLSDENGKEEADNLCLAMDFCKKGLIDGFCFAPLNKAAMKLGGYNFESEHELFAHEFGVTKPHGEMNVLDGLWTSRVTSHIPLKDVSRNLTINKVLDAINLAYDTLKRAGFENPKIAISAINPHGGDSGTCGKEEIDVLMPAVLKANEDGKSVVGPFPSDTLFIKAFEGEYNAVVTMYHDQGQIALKLKGFERGVTVAAGQPFAITTPAHGTAYDIAGKGICKTSAFEEAYKLAAKMAVSDKSFK